MNLVLEFEGEVWYWKGPAPHYFVTVPGSEATQLKDVMRSVTYGWGMIPVTGSIEGVKFTTSLFPKDGGYIVPVKLSVRKQLGIGEGDRVRVRLLVAVKN